MRAITCRRVARRVQIVTNAMLWTEGDAVDRARHAARRRKGAPSRSTSCQEALRASGSLPADVLAGTSTSTCTLQLARLAGVPMTDKKSATDWVSEGLFLGALSAVVSAATLYRQAGHWVYLNVPIQFIEIDGATLFAGLAKELFTLMVVYFLVIPAFDMIIAIASVGPRESKLRRPLRLLNDDRVPMGVAFFAFVGLFAFSDPMKRLLYYPIIASIAYLVSFALVKVVAHVRPKALSASEVTAFRGELARGLRFHRAHRRELITTFFVLMYVFFITDQSVTQMREREQFFVYKSEGGEEVAILAFTSDKAVGFTYGPPQYECVKRATVKKRPLLNLRIIPLSDTSKRGFEWTSLGRLLPAGSKPGTKTSDDALPGACMRPKPSAPAKPSLPRPAASTSSVSLPPDASGPLLQAHP